MSNSEDDREYLGTTYGSYRVTGIIGKGGMGTVFAAEHVQIGKRAAIKILHGQYAKDPNIVARFFREARLVNEIHHENIVDIFDFGTEKDGTPYFVMELLEGESLSTRLKRERPLPEATVLDVGVQIAQALAAVHRLGIVHRDLKPDNIFLVERAKRRDFVKLLDFGIAKVVEGTNEDHLTRTGTILGTPVYMAPEQIKGRPVDQRTDVYALGAILYECVTGRPPFLAGDGGVLRLLSQHLMEDPEPPRRLNPQLGGRTEEAILRCLKKEPGERFNTMSELAAALERGERVVANPAAVSHTASELPVPPVTIMATPAPEPPKSKKTGLIAGVSAAVLLVGGLAVWQVAARSSGATAATDAGAAVVSADGGAAATAGKDAGAAAERPATAGADAGVVKASTDAADKRAKADAGAVSAADGGTTGSARSAGTQADATASTKPKAVRVELATEPPGAEVMEGNLYLGRTPVFLEVAAARRLVLSHVGYRDQAVELGQADAPKRVVTLVALPKSERRVKRVVRTKTHEDKRQPGTAQTPPPGSTPPVVTPPRRKKGIGLED